uniref:Uncharacterized protein n=1 Tax=Anguilla anguilla TaxID=7936 RepID=A0A0E9XJ77_ANGAN
MLYKIAFAIKTPSALRTAERFLPGVNSVM